MTNGGCDVQSDSGEEWTEDGRCLIVLIIWIAFRFCAPCLATYLRAPFNKIGNNCLWTELTFTRNAIHSLDFAMKVVRFLPPSVILLTVLVSFIAKITLYRRPQQSVQAVKTVQIIFAAIGL